MIHPLQAIAARWRGWVELSSRTEAGTSLALFRILTGSAVLVVIGSVVLDDLVGVLWIDYEYGGYLRLRSGRVVQALGGATPGVIGSLVGVTLAAAALLTVGVLARPSALVAAQGLMALTSLNTHARSAYDPLLVNSLWLLVLADSTATLSLRCRLRDRRWTSDRQVSAWPRYLAIVQLIVLYTGTGLHKISIHWTPAGGFSALYYILQQPSWQRGDMTWMASVYPLTQVGTAVTWLWELTWPVVGLALWFRTTADRPGRLRALFNRIPVRGAYVVTGLLMHTSVSVLMVIGPFTWITFAYYPCLFRPQELRAAWDRIARRGVADADRDAAAPADHGESTDVAGDAASSPSSAD